MICSPRNAYVLISLSLSETAATNVLNHSLSLGIGSEILLLAMAMYVFLKVVNGKGSKFLFVF